MFKIINTDGNIKRDKAYIKVHLRKDSLFISLLTEDLWEHFCMKYPRDLNVTLAVMEYIKQLPTMTSVFLVSVKPIDVYFAGKVVLTINC